MATISSRIFHSAIVAAILLLSSAQAAELTLQTVLDNYRQAIGGAAAIDNVQSVYIEGKTLATENSPEMPFKAWYEPKQQRLRLEYTYMGVPGVVSYDGERGWNVLPVVSNRQPLPMQGMDLQQIREQADFYGPLLASADDNVKLALLSPQQTDAGELQRVEVTRSFTVPQQTPEQDAAADAAATEEITETAVWKLDSTSWLPQVVVSEDRLADGSTSRLTVRYDDYREVTGPGRARLVWPHRVASDDGSGEPQINELAEIRLNVPLDQIVFDLSADPR
jgi:hypothetical protein